MTTFYIEEISSDEEDDHDNAIEPNTNTNTILKTDEDTTTTKLSYNQLKTCPLKIGGGASLTVIGSKAYVFGGCNRSGKPSCQLHCYDFGTCCYFCKWFISFFYPMLSLFFFLQKVLLMYSHFHYSIKNLKTKMQMNGIVI